MSKYTHFPVQGIYHVFNKSIAGFGIFKFGPNAQRFIETLDYYNNITVNIKFSKAIENKQFIFQNLLLPKYNSLIKFISYCIMPDHYHLLVRLQTDNTLSKFINNVENSFSRFLNIKLNRKGPLWQSRFKPVQINSDEQLLHVSRYIHLNPTTSNLVDKPENWRFSSFPDLMTNPIYLEKISEISIKNPSHYQKFVENNLDYQQKLKIIRKQMID